MENKYFLSQIKRELKNGEYVYTKGVVVHNNENDALNGFHAYFGAYGYGKDVNCDYVACFVSDMSGAVIKSEVDNRIPVEQPANNTESEG